MASKKSFRIYEKRHASGNLGFRVDLGLIKGRRSFKSFGTRTAAEAFRNKQLTAENTKHPQLLADIDQITRHEVLAAMARLAPHGASIKEAVDFYLKHGKPRVLDATLQQVIDEFKRVKTQAGLSAIYLEKSESSFFNPFRDHFKNRLFADVSAAECETYIYRKKSWTVATQKTHIRHLSVLFNFAIGRGFATINPFKDIQQPKLKSSTAKGRVASIESVIAILQYALKNGYKPECAALVLVLFCGVRTDEVAALAWEDVRLTEESPHVVLDETKANRRRVNEVPENAVKWLTLLRTKGPIVGGNYEGRMRYLRKISKSEFKQNTPRVSFCSYHVARWEDASKTSVLLGHQNPSLLWTTYRAVVTKASAVRYWKIVPSYDGTIESERAENTKALKESNQRRFRMLVKG